MSAVITKSFAQEYPIKKLAVSVKPTMDLKHVPPDVTRSHAVVNIW
jgi:hypothetical protein